MKIVLYSQIWIHLVLLNLVMNNRTSIEHQALSALCKPHGIDILKKKNRYGRKTETFPQMIIVDG